MSHAREKRGFLGFFTSHSPAAAAAILLVVGGAFAGTAAVVTKWIVTEEPVGDTQKHVVIQDEDGNVVLDDVMDNDTGIFAIDGDGSEDDPSMLLELKAVGGGPESLPAASTAQPNAKKQVTKNRKATGLEAR